MVFFHILGFIYRNTRLALHPVRDSPVEPWVKRYWLSFLTSSFLLGQRAKVRSDLSQAMHANDSSSLSK